MGGAVAIALFLFGIQLLGTATEAGVAPLRQFFGTYIASDVRALGASWVATYAVTTGSVIAALAVSLFSAEIITGPQLYLMVAGSRLGAAAIVVLIGVLDYLQKKRYSFGEGVSLGLLTFLITHSVFIPATVLGYLILPGVSGRFDALGETVDWRFRPLEFMEPLTDGIIELVDVGPGFVLAILLLFAGLNLFDRVLKRVDTGWLRQRFFKRFQRRWVALGFGFLLTALTTSVAFSLGVIVPLYNRRYLKRREVLPYILGANIGTLFDTVVVAVVLNSPVGVSIVGLLIAVAMVFTVIALVWFGSYHRLMKALHQRLVSDRRFLAAFLLSLVVIPIVLAVLPF